MNAKKIFLSTLIIIAVVLLAIGVFVNTGPQTVTADDTLDKIKDKKYIDKIRDIDSIRIPNDKDTHYKSYDSSEKTFTIEGKDFKKQFEVRLDSKYFENVGVGEDVQFAELTYIEYMDELYEDIELYSVGDGYRKIQKDIVTKYKTENTVLHCSIEELRKDYDPLNPKETCFDNTIVSWVEFNNINQLPYKDITIGLFTDTLEGEHVEWVIVKDGFKILEWAEWNASWENGITQFYKLDDTNTTLATDFFGNHDGINSGAEVEQSGILGSSYLFVAANTDNVLADSGVIGDNTMSMAGWFKTTTSSGEQKFILANTDTTADQGWGAGVFNNAFRLIIPGVAWGAGTTAVSDGNWHSFVATKDGTSYSLYLDGSTTPVSTHTSASGTFDDKFKLGGNSFGPAWYNGNMDNIGVWNRVLTSNEIIDWHNGGTGITPTLPVLCEFAGFVFDEDDNALEGANVTVWNQFDVSEFYEDTTDINGLWAVNISNSTNTYMSGAYFNNTIIGQLKPYISGTC